MICAICKYEWCWICGFKDYNGEGSKSDGFNFHFFIMFQCNMFGLLTFLPWYLSIPLGLLSFVTLPLIIFLFILFISIGLFHDIYLRNPRSYFLKLFVIRTYNTTAKIIFIFVPLWILLISTFILFSALLMAIIILPFYIMTVFVLIRMIWWWN